MYAQVQAVAAEIGRGGPAPKKVHGMNASALIAKLGEGAGGYAKRLGKTWQKNIAKKQLKKLDCKEHLDQLFDTFARADENDRDGLDPVEFTQAFTGHFPPWRSPVDENIASVTLTTLFAKIDANGLAFNDVHHMLLPIVPYFYG